jgi:predicted nucleic acid-binding protein
VLIPTIVLGELAAGFRLGSRSRQNQQVLGEFLDEPFVAVLDVTAEVGQRYGEIFSRLRERGTPIPTNDIWIAACAFAAQATLITYDTHFEKIEQLDCRVLALGEE